jgi:hypothetical protein
MSATRCRSTSTSRATPTWPSASGTCSGSRFLENFDYPYVARSITEFWRRWHISLSTWFRDYLYIPLGGSRVRAVRTYLNLLTVFSLCGLWHGASFSFARLGPVPRASSWCSSAPSSAACWSARRACCGTRYTLLAVMVGWVFFRATTLEQALSFLRAMFGIAPGDARRWPIALYVDPLLVTVIVCGTIACVPWVRRVLSWRDALETRGRLGPVAALETAGTSGGAAAAPVQRHRARRARLQPVHLLPLLRRAGTAPWTRPRPSSDCGACATRCSSAPSWSPSARRWSTSSCATPRRAGRRTSSCAPRPPSRACTSTWPS